jgi:putative ABC transport system permease protein
VIGAEVAARLGYRTGQQITLQHGASHLDAHHDDEDATHPEHADKPSGSSASWLPPAPRRDRTPSSLQALEAIHLDWQGGMPMPGLEHSGRGRGQVRPHPEAPQRRADRPASTHRRVPRAAPDQRPWRRALMAILPGLAMDELWQLMGSVERTLHGLAWLVMAAGLAGGGDRRQPG